MKKKTFEGKDKITKNYKPLLHLLSIASSSIYWALVGIAIVNHIVKLQRFRKIWRKEAKHKRNIKHKIT